MRAMVLKRQGAGLELIHTKIPEPKSGELLIKVTACGICRTDLHILDGELHDPALPLIPGHQVSGIVEGIGEGVSGFRIGDRAGVPWLGGSCGECPYCENGRENLCDNAIFTGYHRNGGFAEYCTASASFSFHIPERFSPAQAAPLLCAGLIGYRSLMMAGDCRKLGIYGFGAAAHIVAQVASWQGQEVYAFTRDGDEEGKKFALRMGACWSGGSSTLPPCDLDAAIIFAPAGELVPLALRAIRKGGTVVCGGIHMSDIPSFPYELLWGERKIASVANLTRRDGEEFLDIAARIPVICEIQTYPLENANEALAALRDGKIKGAGVLLP